MVVDHASRDIPAGPRPPVENYPPRSSIGCDRQPAFAASDQGKRSSVSVCAQYLMPGTPFQEMRAKSASIPRWAIRS
jgi:hypothetical protein